MDASVWVAIITALASALAVYVFHKRKRDLLDLPLIPGPWKHSLPILGNVLDFARPDFHRALLKWANEYGGIVRGRLLWYDGLMVTDPAAVAQICGRGEGALDKASPIYVPINQMCTPRAHPNLLTSPADPAWRAVRKAVAAAFSMVNIRKKYPVIQQCSSKLMQQLICLSQDAAQAGQPAVTVDIDQAALRVTLDVIGMAGFDHNFRCLEDALPTQPAAANHLLRVLPRCFTEVMFRMLNPFRCVWPKRFDYGVKGDLAFRAFQSEMRTLLRKCLLRPTPPARDDVSISAQLWRAYHEQDNAPATPSATLPTSTHPAADIVAVNDAQSKSAQSKLGDEDETSDGLLPPPPSKLEKFMNCLRDIRSMVTFQFRYPQADKTKQEPLLSAERILGEIGILFIEGFETTGHTIAWTLLNIATVPGVQDRILEELQQHDLLAKAHPDDGTVSLPHLEVETLQQLPYLTACTKEAMRMLPVVSVMARKVGDKPTRIGPYLVPPHTPVGIPLFAIQNCDRNWESPHEFRPDRWHKVPVESYVVGRMPPLPAINVDATAAINKTKSMTLSAETLAKLNTTTSTAGADQEIVSAGSSWTAVAAPIPGNTSTVTAAPGSVAGSDAAAGFAAAPAGEADQTVVPSPTEQKAAAAEAGDSLDGWDTSSRKGGEIRFMPFSEGPRNCVGQTLAKLEVLTVLAQLLGCFRIELSPDMGGREGVRARESTHLTLQFKGVQGLRMILHPRWDTSVAKAEAVRT